MHPDVMSGIFDESLRLRDTVNVEFIVQRRVLGSLRQTTGSSERNYSSFFFFSIPQAPENGI
jgi:hypothetical protein